MRSVEVPQKNVKLRKTLKEFWRNGSCTQYRQRKIQSRRLKNDVHVTRLCAHLYRRYRTYGEYTHEIYCTNMQWNMSK